ncbi:MAG: DUF4270 family protein [Saprospiraceae bacterium]|nr:DUF4270 family protein [Saprospiraceae bacterium]
MKLSRTANAIGKGIICLFLFLQISCNKTSDLGTDLISDDWIHAIGVDYTNIKLSAIHEDSLTYAAAGFPPTLFVGNTEDPIFGTLKAELFTQLNFAVTKELAFLKGSVDSIILSVKYDSSSSYGDLEALHSIHVYQLQDTLKVSKAYMHSDLNIRYSPEILGTLNNFKPNLKDSVKFKIDTIQYGFSPQLRIPLDTNKFMGILRNFSDTVFNNLSSFYEQFRGLAIVPQNKASLLALQPSNSESRVTIYYTIDNKKAQFNFFFGSSMVSYNRVDNSNSKAEPFIKNTVSGDSIAFMQGFNGTSLRVQIPYDSTWNERLIKYAVLEIYSPEVSGDDTKLYKRPPYVMVKDKNTPQPYQNIIDARYALASNSLNELIRSFGGNLSKTTLNGEEVSLYRCNITGHFINAKKAKKDIDIILSPLYKVYRADRLVIGGSKNSKYGTKLKLVFSEQ